MKAAKTTFALRRQNRLCFVASCWNLRVKTYDRIHVTFGEGAETKVGAATAPRL